MPHLDEGTIHAWLDGALDAEASAVVEAHALSCAACGALVAEARGLVAGASRILGALDEVPGDVIPVAPVAGVVPIGAAPRRRSVARLARIAAALVVVAGSAGVVLQFGVRAKEAPVATATSGAESGSAPLVELSQPVAAREPATTSAPAPPPPAVRPAAGPVAVGLGNRANVAADASAPARPLGRAAAEAERAREERIDALAQAAVERREPSRRVLAPLQLRQAADSLVAPRAEQPVLVGIVRDRATGEPVAGASILLDNGDIGTITDHLGRFTITGATAGVHRAQVRRVGYASSERDVRLGNDSAVLELALAPERLAVVQQGVLGNASLAPTEAAQGMPRRPAGASGAKGADKREASAATPTSPAAAPAGAPTSDVVVAAPAPDVALSSRAAASRILARGRVVTRDAAGSCLVVQVRLPDGDRLRAATDGLALRLETEVSRDDALDAGYGATLLRAADLPARASASWSTAGPADDDDLGELLLHWRIGDERVRVRLPWSTDSRLSGVATVQRGRGGAATPATADAQRVSCLKLK